MKTYIKTYMKTEMKTDMKKTDMTTDEDRYVYAANSAVSVPYVCIHCPGQITAQTRTSCIVHIPQQGWQVWLQSWSD